MTQLEPPLLSPEFMASLDRLDVLSRKILAGKMKGERRSKRRGQSVEFADFRNYVIGDDLRFIDWNIYARLDRLFLKLFHEEEDLSLHLLLDLSGSCAYGNPDKGLFMRRLTAALAYVGLVNHNRVTVTALSSGVVAQSGAMRGRRRVARMIDFISGLRPEGPGRLEAACRAFSMSQKSRGVCVIISDFLDKGGFEPGLRYLIAGRYDLYAIQVLAPQEIDPKEALQGDLKLTDIEDGEVAEVSVTAALLKRYRATLNAYCTQLREYLTRRGGVYVLTSTSTDVEDLVLQVLRGRRLLG
jgi:uncharacterized protein (DUF58 family)